MFRELKTLFARSWEAFVTERDRREPEDRVADMLIAMRQELTEVRAALPLLDREVEAADAELARENGEREACERRRMQAERIGDAETARVAAEWRDRHAARVAVLRDKRQAAAAERELRGREAGEMTERLRSADAHRHALVAELRARGRALADDADAAATEEALFRAEEKIRDAAALQDALGELEGEPAPAPAARGAEVDARLRELKRRMGAE